VDVAATEADATAGTQNSSKGKTASAIAQRINRGNLMDLSPYQTSEFVVMAR
jgi:hypothetical protein